MWSERGPNESVERPFQSWSHPGTRFRREQDHRRGNRSDGTNGGPAKGAVAVVELNALLFEVVRRGYDVDEVNAHLANVERQRGAELERAQAAIAQKDNEIDRLRRLTSQLDEVQAQKAEATTMLDDAGRRRETMLAEASRAAREQTTMAAKTAAGLRSQTEQEMSTLRRDTEAEMSELRATTRQETDRKLNEAKSEARQIDQ